MLTARSSSLLAAWLLHDRPSVCRSYTCADDDRIWKDFDAMELNHEFIDAKLSGEIRAVMSHLQYEEKSSARIA